MPACVASERMPMLHLAYLWILSFRFLQLCNANDIPCTVTRVAGGTLYSVPEFHATDCQFYWTNTSGYVLAHHEGKMSNLVVSNRSLRISGCLEQVHYKRDCISEGAPYEANCSTNCTGNAESLSGGDRLTTLSPETKPGHLTAVPRRHWIVPVVIVLVLLVLLVLVVLLVVLCYKQRCKYCRNTNSSVV